jgi:hypothetical protein
MGLLLRLRVVMSGVISITFVGIIFDRLALDLVTRIENQAGPFSELAGQVETLVPLVLSLLLLALVVWLVFSSVQSERARSERRVRRP